MSKERECAEKLRAIVGKEPFGTYLAKVTKVDSSEAVCTVERVFDGMVIEDVKLNATITKDEGIVISPKQNSFVLITSIDGLNWFVSLYSAIDKITIDAESKIIFNGGENKGLIQIEKLTQKLNDLVRAIATHTHPAPGGATGVTTSRIPNFIQSDYEDTKITH